MPTRNRLRVALLSRVPGISALDMSMDTKAPTTIFVVPKETSRANLVREQVKNALFHIAPAGMHYDIAIVDHLPTSQNQNSPSLPGSHYLASLAPDPTESGIKEAMMRLVPRIGRIEITSPRPGTLHLMVEDFKGNADKAFLDEVRKAFSAISTVGIDWAVVPWSQASTSATPSVPTGPRKAKMISLSETDESLFADRIRQLTTTDQIPPIPLVDKARGTQVLYIPGAAASNPGLGSFLALYDRVFVLMLGSKAQDKDDFEHFHGIPYPRFLDFARSGRVVPIFRNRLEYYSEDISRPIVDDLSLQYLSSRDLDYLAARYAWTSSPFLIPALRRDQTITQAIFEIVHAASTAKGMRNPQIQATSNIFNSALMCAESFEGLLWRNGFLCLGEMGPGAGINYALRAAAMESSHISHGQRDTVIIEAHLASTSVALAQSMNASLSEGILLNDAVVEAVASAFLPIASQNSAIDQPKRLAQIVSSLKLSYSNNIPPDEYLDLFDRAETRRIRSIAADILKNPGSNSDNERNLRDHIAQLNHEVAKIAKKSLESADIDILGDIVTSTAPPAGATIVADMLKLAGLPTIRKSLSLAADIIIEDTAIGSFVDKIRGGLNGVSSHAIRLYRVRKKLGALRQQE